MAHVADGSPQVLTPIVNRVRPHLDPDAVVGAMDGLLRVDPDNPGRSEAYLPSPCPQNHAANLLELVNGDLCCVWFGGTMEGTGDISIYLSRLPAGGTRWCAPVQLSDDPARSEQNPVLFEAPDRQLFLLFTAQIRGRQETAIVRYRVSEDGGAHFGRTSALVNAPGTFVRQPVIANRTGDWLLPTFLCRTTPGVSWVGDDDVAAVRISRDQGATWTERIVPESRGCVHMNIVPLGGDRQVAFFRSRRADWIHRTTSVDGGLSWAPPEPTTLPNNNSSVQAIRLASGRLAMVYNHSSRADAVARRTSLYDEIEDDAVAAPAPGPADKSAFWGAPRAPLSVALSEDEGRSWLPRVDLEIGDGYCLTNNSRDRLNREFSYPSICQSRSGAIEIAFTYFRQAIKHVRVDEDWIRGRALGGPAA
jgi:predicted neuraminidase